MPQSHLENAATKFSITQMEKFQKKGKSSKNRNLRATGLPYTKNHSKTDTDLTINNTWQISDPKFFTFNAI